jgi:hypothetical protein
MPLLARAKLGSKDRQCQAALAGKRLVFGVALQGRRVKSIFTRLQMKSLLAAAAHEAGAAAPLPHQPASPPPAWPHAPSKSASGKDRRDASLFPPRAITTSPSKLPPPLSGEPRRRLEAGPVIVRPLDSGVALAPKDDRGLGLSELGARKLGSPASTLAPSLELELAQPLLPSGKPPPASQLRAFTRAPHSRL